MKAKSPTMGESPSDYIEMLHNLMRPVQNTSKEYGFIRISSRGRFELHCYNTGLLWVSVFTNKSPHTIGYTTRLYIGNIDDGDWGAWSAPTTKEKSHKLVNRINEELFPEWCLLPTSKEINEQLAPYGLYGEFE